MPGRDMLISQALKATCVQQTPCPCMSLESRAHVKAYETRITTCWKKYERRYRALAHLASYVLIVLKLL